MRVYDAGGDLTKRWYVDLYIVGDDLQTHRRQIYDTINEVHNLRDRQARARRVLLDVEDKMARGVWDDTGRPVALRPKATLTQELEAKLGQISPSLRPATVCNYRNALAMLRQWEAGLQAPCNAAGLTPDHGESYMDWLRGREGISNSSRNGYYRAARSLIGHVRKRDNPFRGVASLKERRERNVSIHPDDLPALLAEIDRTNEGLGMFFRSIYYLGIRRSELCHLQATDVDLARGLVHLPASITKSGRAAWVRIPGPFRETLADWIQGRPGWAYVFDPVEPAKPNTFTRAFVRAIERLGWKGRGYSLYSARHTMARAMIDAGIGILDVSRHLRHSSPRVTDQYLRNIGGLISDAGAETFPALP